MLKMSFNSHTHTQSHKNKIKWNKMRWRLIMCGKSANKINYFQENHSKRLFNGYVVKHKFWCRFFIRSTTKQRVRCKLSVNWFVNIYSFYSVYTNKINSNNSNHLSHKKLVWSRCWLTDRHSIVIVITFIIHTFIQNAHVKSKHYEWIL